jgi:hypothetical protein
MAQYMLGMMYSDGNFAEKIEKTAIYWIELCANQDWSLAQASLGLTYQCNHKSTPENAQKAAYCFKKVVAEEKDHLDNSDKSYNLFGSEKFRSIFNNVEKETMSVVDSACKSALVNVNKILLSPGLDGTLEFGYLMFWLSMSNPFYNVPVSLLNLGLIHNGLHHYTFSNAESIDQEPKGTQVYLESCKTRKSYCPMGVNCQL